MINTFQETLMHHRTVDSDCGCEIMTPRQVAEYLHVSPRTIYSRWEKLGGVRIGRTIRFRKEVIDALFGPEEKQMERGGEKTQQEICKPQLIQNKNRSKGLGDKKKRGTEESRAEEHANRHGLADSL
jgi:excisionase family DNA binding protein